MTLLQTAPISIPDSVPSIKQELAMAESLPFDDLINKVTSAFITFAINLAIAIVVFYVGKFIIRKVYKLVQSILTHRQVDRSLTTFILSMIKIVLYFILLVTVIGILGIETSSFIAIFASAGVAIGMALSGTLQNFAGGVLILLLKPYKVGDYIETQGYAGYVREIQIFSTIITTYDNKSIIIPNGGLSTGSINNWSREDYRRVDWNVSISYGDDVENARRAILEIIHQDPRVVTKFVEDDRLKYNSPKADPECEENPQGEDCMEEVEKPSKNILKRMIRRHHRRVAQKLENIREERQQQIAAQNPPVDRSPVVALNNMGASSVDLVCRAWTRSEFYWAVFYDINERLYSELPKHGVSFPFPQLDVHLNTVSSPV